MCLEPFKSLSCRWRLLRGSLLPKGRDIYASWHWVCCLKHKSYHTPTTPPLTHSICTLQNALQIKQSIVKNRLLSKSLTTKSQNCTATGEKTLSLQVVPMVYVRASSSPGPDKMERHPKAPAARLLSIFLTLTMNLLPMSPSIPRQMGPWAQGLWVHYLDSVTLGCPPAKTIWRIMRWSNDVFRMVFASQQTL